MRDTRPESWGRTDKETQRKTEPEIRQKETQIKRAKDKTEIRQNETEIEGETDKKIHRERKTVIRQKERQIQRERRGGQTEHFLKCLMEEKKSILPKRPVAKRAYPQSAERALCR